MTKLALDRPPVRRTLPKHESEMLDHPQRQPGARFESLNLVLLAIALSGGCAATVPMAAPGLDLAAKMSAPPRDGALIYVYRNEAFGGAVKMPIFIDGTYRGDTVAKSFLVAPVAPGPHEVLSKTENDSRITVMAEAGRAYFIWQEVKMGLMMARSELQPVDEARGRAAVNECRLIASAAIPPSPAVGLGVRAPLPAAPPAIAAPPPNLGRLAPPTAPAPVSVAAPATTTTVASASIDAPMAAPTSAPSPAAMVSPLSAPTPAVAPSTSVGWSPPAPAANLTTTVAWAPSAATSTPGVAAPATISHAALAPPAPATPPSWPAQNAVVPATTKDAATPPANPGAHRHDGFFLRFGMGPGYAAAHEEKSSGKVSGTSFTGFLAIGWTPIEDLAIHLNSEVDMLLSARVDLPSGRVANDQSDTLRNVGLGLSYYLMPFNLYVSGALTAAKGYRQPAGQSRVEESEWGLGMSVSAGKEWWVSDNWGLGVFGRVNVAAFDGQRPGETYTANALTLGGSFTFN